MTSSDSVVVAYVSSPHAGYLKFFRAYTGSILYVLGNDFVSQFSSLVRNMPGVAPEESQKMIQALGIFSDVRILHLQNLEAVQRSELGIVMPDEDVSHAIAEKHLVGTSITFDGSWRLRWHWSAAVQKSRIPEGERKISFSEFDRAFMRQAVIHADRSPDWWRQIAAFLVRDGQMLFAAFNRHVPNEQSVYLYGDPRSNFEVGQSIEVSAALHAEAGIVAEAARQGVSMEGCDLYVTTFPCPQCAYMCAFTGIKRLYYADGYSLVAGAETLQSKNVEIIRVEMNDPSS